MDEGWFTELEPFLCSPKGDLIFDALKEEKKHYKIYPDALNCFNAFKYKLENLKVVILGQDPYYTPGVATGLAFSISDKAKKVPPSLRTIEDEIRVSHFNEYKDMRYYDRPFKYNLTHWADQGVLLLNTALTVRENEPSSHLKIWKPFINFVFLVLNKYELIYLLWGNHAKKYKDLIEDHNHILESPHPSPLARGFKGNNHFILTNNILKEKKNEQGIRWL